MGTVRRMVTEIERGLREAHPTLRKTVVTKVALAVGAILEARTPNTVDLANLLPLDTGRQDMREQWLRRLLKNPLLSGAELLEVAKQYIPSNVAQFIAEKKMEVKWMEYDWSLNAQETQK